MRVAGPQWQEDILGPDYQALALRVPARAAPTRDGSGREGSGSPAKNTAAKNTAATAAGTAEPDRTGPTAAAYQEHVAVSYRATLVRHRPVARPEDAAPPPPAAKPAVLFIHGWSDYFYNTGLAEFFTSHGYSFYAVDLHNHGRSLTSHEMGGYVADLADYDAEILAAHAVIAQEHAGMSESAAGNAPILLMGHSTGGLIATLWAHHHPGLVSHLVLNSPWLEIQGGAAIRRAATPLVQLADLRPLMRMRVPERSFYWRGISDEAYGEWPVDKKLRPPHAFPVRAGWMKAILAAQQEVAAGLKLPMPVLVLLSTKSMLGPIWSDAMLRADVVLDVRSLALRTLSLGNSVTLERLEGALHEVLLSPQPVRDDAYARMERWLRGYVGQ